MGTIVCFLSLLDSWMSGWQWRMAGRVTASWCICWASARVWWWWGCRGLEVESGLTKWIVPSNQGKTLTFAFPLNQSQRRKSPPLRGNLFDVWMSECVRPLPKHIHAFTALDRVWVFRSDPAGKLGPFLVTFSPHVGCLAGGPSCSQGWTSSGSLIMALFFLDLTVLYCMSLHCCSGEAEMSKKLHSTKTDFRPTFQIFPEWTFLTYLIDINSYQAYTTN